LGTSVG